MKFKLSIAAKIALGFGIITIAVIVNAMLTRSILNNNSKVNNKINTVYEPSSMYLNQLEEAIKNTRMLIRSWVFIDKKPESADKTALKEIHENIFPHVDSALMALSESWNENEKELYQNVATTIKDTLFPRHQYIMSLLNSFESYDDPLVIFEVIPMVEEGGEVMELTDSIISTLTSLIHDHSQLVTDSRVEMASSFQNFGNFIVSMGIGLVLASIIIGLITIRSLVRPINYLKGLLLSMSKGILPENKIAEGKDEIGQMSYAVNMLINSQQSISDFAQEIGKGNFNSDFKPLSNEDTLGNSLLNMRGELKNAATEEEKRKKEDAQRNWATQGQAKFAEILRMNNDNMAELSYNIISNLVKYINANQGGLFLINDNDEADLFIELMACYAYDRRKYMEKRIELGEGLIGRCLQENEAIYMTEIPKNYIQITSGTGGNSPRSLFIVPLIVNEKQFGVIELASFDEVEDHKRDFIMKIGESIASTIATVKTNIQTTLLLEQSRQQAEEMHSQEEEMRQNMEELRATQEQSQRREEELQSSLNEAHAKIHEYELRISRLED
ncbi:MAG: GAF domain-containing protein [Bacteroidales bacterium]|nr:GAF domain-containing protein [Bacteroidales bacterium]